MAELAQLGVRAGVASPGVVAFTATTRQVYAACLRSGIASRVLVQVAQFPARTFAALEWEAAAVDWSPWTAGGGTFRVTAAKSRLFHTGAIIERLERIVGSSTGSTGSTGPAGPGEGADLAPPVTPFVVRLDHDHVTISADAGGEPLHRRGWRLATAKAPLRPTLAVAILRTVGWDGTSPLVDPLCGAGTIAIEAAGLRAGLAPGRLRSFAFERWPCFAPGTWASVQGEARVKAAAGRSADRVFAADHDAGACAATTANAARAGVEIDVRQQPLSAFEAPHGGPGWLVANPPWGARTGAGRDLAEVYAELGQVARHQLAGWGVALLVADARLAQATGLPLGHRWSTLSGGTRVHLFATPAGGV